MNKQSGLNMLLREPLLHFLLIGAFLFLLYGIQNETIVDSNRITISEADIDRLAKIWQKKMLRPPSQTELDGLIEQQIREEVFYREALKMGLDKNDTIVRRRLAQKVEFISSDLATQVEPTDEELADFLSAQPGKFLTPARISFTQIYFNTERRGNQIESNALNVLKDLDLKTDVSAMGDPFMIGQQHQQITEIETSRLFGGEFAEEIMSLPAGNWQGPVFSVYGLHLVKINSKQPASQPALNTIREKVKNEWFTQQRHTINKNFYQSLRQGYEIIIDKPAPENKVSLKK